MMHMQSNDLFTFETAFTGFFDALRSINIKCIAMNKIIIPDVPKVVIIFRLKEKDNINCILHHYILLIFNNYDLIYSSCFI